jgi:hypothetical protein
VRRQDDAGTDLEPAGMQQGDAAAVRMADQYRLCEPELLQQWCM